MLRRWRQTRTVGLCDPQVNPQCSPQGDWPADGLLRLLSFNVQVGINTQRYHHYLTRGWQHLLPHAGRAGNLQRIGDLLADFDLVALQEVDGGSLRSGYVNQV
ncbi:MAG: EEP domain-containing protein, partial [Pseudomonadales bacterium]